jgi:hypothetical protein
MASRDSSPTRKYEIEKVEHTWGIAKQVIYAVWSGRPKFQLLPYLIDEDTHEQYLIDKEVFKLNESELSKIETKHAGFAISVDWEDVHPKEPYVVMVGALRQLLEEIETTTLACPEAHFVFVHVESVRFNKMGHIRISYRHSSPISVDIKTNRPLIKEDDFWPRQLIWK